MTFGDKSSGAAEGISHYVHAINSRFDFRLDSVVEV